jgi:hypothetical protein
MDLRDGSDYKIVEIQIQQYISEHNKAQKNMRSSLNNRDSCTLVL